MTREEGIQVMGMTTQQEVYIGSKDRNFKINEFLMVEDPKQGAVPGEVVEAMTYNRYIPMDKGGEFVDASALESMRHLGYDIDDETNFIAKLRLLNEAPYPILTGSNVYTPTFEELRDIVSPVDPDDGLIIGVLKNTEELAVGMDDNLKGLVKTIEAGKLKEQSELPYIFDLKSMHQYPHIGVFGGSGSGKSFGLRVILEELMKKRIPSIILDPHYEMDFSNAGEGFDDVSELAERTVTVQVGEHVGIKFEELSAGELKNLLDAASPLSDSMRSVVDVMLKHNDSCVIFMSRLEALARAQEEGSIEALRAKAERCDAKERSAVLEEIEVFEKYNRVCNQQSVKGVLWRLRSIDKEGIFANSIDRIKTDLKMGRLIVVRGTNRMLQVFSTYLIRKLYYLRRDYRDEIFRGRNAEFFPPFVIITDEAHNFSPKGVDVPSKSIIKEISQEGRKYGVFLILASQRPTLLDETVTAQLNTKFIFRTVRASDIQTIKEETDLSSDETKRLPYLSSGDVFISSASRGRTSFVRIRAACTRSPHGINPFDELSEKFEEAEKDLYESLKRYLPIGEADFLKVQMALEKDSGIVLGREELKSSLDSLVKKGKIKLTETVLFNRYETID